METIIPWGKPDFWGKEQEYLSEALASSWISGGPFVERFERDFAAYTGVSHAISASNGTTALQLAYLAIGLGPGDEIIVPGFSFLASANVAMNMGAKPVFAEVDPTTWCVTAEAIEKCLSPQTRAIVPVHTYGNVCDMDSILQLTAKHNIIVIEDAAEAFASRYKDKLAGTMSSIGSFSFQATKTITTGEGGMIVTENKDYYDKMALYRSHGMLRKKFYWHELAGYNFRITNLQAALGVAQLEKLDKIIPERKRVHKTYIKYLGDNQGLNLQKFSHEVDSVLWAIAVRLEPDAYPQGRDRVIEQLLAAGIETRPGFYTPSQMPHIYNCPPLPICEGIARQVISLPTYPSLKDEEIKLISETLTGLQK